MQCLCFFVTLVFSASKLLETDAQFCTRKNPDGESTMTEETKPGLIVFDLEKEDEEEKMKEKKRMAQQEVLTLDLKTIMSADYTLWPFWVDTHVSPPFTLKSNGKVFDSTGDQVKYYPEVPAVLQQLHNEGYKLGIASRTGSIEDAKELVKLFDWKKYFEFSEIYPGKKTNHFSRFHEKSKLPYSEMLFFDDEHRNIVDVSKLGVTCILVENGVTKKVLQEGLEAFAKNKRKGNC